MTRAAWSSHRNAAIGRFVASGFFVEGRVSTLRGEATESSPAVGTDAPYTLGLRVVLVDVRAGMRPEMLRLGPLQPVASIGGVWARLTDTWTSDTPTERHRSATPGLGATLGVETTLSRQATLAVSGVTERCAASTIGPSGRSDFHASRGRSVCD